MRRQRRGASRRFRRGLSVALACAGFAAVGVAVAPAATSPTQGATPGAALSPDSGAAKHHDKSPPLRSLPPSHTPGTAHPARPVPGPSALSNARAQNTSGGTLSSPLAPTSGANFDGITANGSAPPDNDGAAGPTQYVELVNTKLAVYSKRGDVLVGPEATNTLWSGFGGGCQNNNDGDGTVLFDTVSQRWVIQQFSVTGANGSSVPYLDCVAISTSSDATGSYYRYSFSYSNFPDYPKMGVWPDAYYASFNMFQGNSFLGAEMCAFDRAAMLTGAAAGQQCFTPSSAQTSVLPATIDGPTPPPTGEPEWFVGLSPTQSNALAYWKFHVDWSTPANSTLTGPTNLSVNSFSQACGGGTCIPQAGTHTLLDSLGDRLMFRLAYRNFGGHEAMVVSHSVTTASSVGMRWYELRPSGGALSVFQQGTYAPDSTYRWMGSIAMDQAGDMALGYSSSSSALHPAVAYAGRLVGDPSGMMPQGETTLFSGAGSQTRNLTRWGDYSEMSVDPSDDCTFWYVNEYEPANGSFNWHTRIGSFKFPSCGQQASFTASPSSVSSGAPISVSWSGVGNPTSRDWVGVYQPGDPNDDYLDWFYDNSCTQTPGTGSLASGSCTYHILASGTYELRLFSNDGFNPLATSNPITVSGGATLTVSPSSVNKNGTVTVTWSGIGSPTSTDWVGVYHQGGSIGNYLNWFYADSCTQTAGSNSPASGNCTYKMPNTSGTYEFRLFAHDSYTLLATSNPTTVG